MLRTTRLQKYMRRTRTLKAGRWCNELEIRSMNGDHSTPYLAFSALLPLLNLGQGLSSHATTFLKARARERHVSCSPCEVRHSCTTLEIHAANTKVIQHTQPDLHDTSKLLNDWLDLTPRSVGSLTQLVPWNMWQLLASENHSFWLHCHS